MGDFTRDGKQDLLALTGSAVEVFPGRGDGTLGQPITTSILAGPNAPNGVVVGDFNRDGRRDIALFHPSQPGSSASVAQVMLGMSSLPRIGSDSDHFNATAPPLIGTAPPKAATAR